MAVYAYTASRDAADRSVIRGTITADSPRHARDQLRRQGLRIREVAEHQPASATPGWLDCWQGRRLSARIIGVLQELSTLLGAGIPLLDALDTLIRQHSGPLRRSLMLLREHVASGGGLAEAMSLQPATYDELCRSIIDVGENAGTLDQSLAQLVQFRRRAAGFRNRIASALLYPGIVLAAGAGVSMFLMTYVLPNVLGVLIESGRKLPAATAAVKAVSDFLVHWGWALAIGVTAFVAVGIAILRTEAGLRGWHRLQLRIPLLGELIRKQAIARLAMVMAALLKSDVVFVRALQIAQRTISNRVLRDALWACEQAVYAGRDIAAAMEKTDAFPPLVVQVFAVGQASGRLETMLEDLAADYDTQVDITSSRLTTLLEPLMMVLLAFLVGSIAFATILPILEAGDVL